MRALTKDEQTILDQREEINALKEQIATLQKNLLVSALVIAEHADPTRMAQCELELLETCLLYKRSHDAGTLHT